jgi:Domain of unknown function (DUF4124)
MRTTLLLLVLLASPVLASQTVWKWVDESGVTHYSDRPVPGATKMEIASSNRAASPDTSSYSSSSSSSTSQRPAQAGPAYTDFEIWKPGDTDTIPNSGGVVDVEVRVNPALQSGHTLYLYLDGGIVEGYPTDTTSFTLTNVTRGSHTVTAIIFADGKRLQEAQPVRFTVRQESIAQPPVGPAQQGPPKPQPRGANKMADSQPTYAALNGGRNVPIDSSTNRPVVRKPAPAGPKSGN